MIQNKVLENGAKKLGLKPMPEENQDQTSKRPPRSQPDLHGVDVLTDPGSEMEFPNILYSILQCPNNEGQWVIHRRNQGSALRKRSTHAFNGNPDHFLFSPPIRHLAGREGKLKVICAKFAASLGSLIITM